MDSALYYANTSTSNNQSNTNLHGKSFLSPSTGVSTGTSTGTTTGTRKNEDPQTGGEDHDEDEDEDEDDDEDSLKLITTHFARLQDEKTQHMKKTRELNMQIKELTVKIESFMKDHDLDDIQLANDKAVKRVVTNRIEPINKETLATILSHHSKIKDIHEAREISEFVFTNRGRNESMAIRYTGGRK